MTDTHIEHDYETRSPVDLRKHGAYVYFEHPETRVLLGSFKAGDKRFRWRDGEPCPPDLAAHVEAGGVLSAHNAGFERLCWKWLHENRGWPLPRIDQFRCTAATSAALQLPRSLDKLGDALDLNVKKDKEGMRLIRKFSIPGKTRPARSFEVTCATCDGEGFVARTVDTDRSADLGDMTVTITQNTEVMQTCETCGGRKKVWCYEPESKMFTEPEDDPEDFEKFHLYCDGDVETEAEADDRMVPLSAHEQAVYVLSEKINDRGIRIDVESAQAALRIADKAKLQLDKKMREITGGAVRKCSEVAKLTAWVNEQGVEVASLAKADLDDALAYPDLPSHVREALETRQEAAKTSTSKVKAMLDRANKDGRVRGTNLYHGAGTGRWASMGVNFANMPRPRKAYEPLRQDLVFEAIRTGDPDYLRFMFGPDLGRPLHLLSDAIRGFIMAAPGCDLIQADYSGIEGAVVAWLADERWKLEEMRKIIADPSIPDLYRQTAAGILSLPLAEVTKAHWARQAVGKPAELGLGYQGGVNAFYTFARAYGVDLDGIAPPVLQNADEETIEKAEKRYRANYKRNQARARELSQDAWVACEIIKNGWRKQNAAIADSWKDLEAAGRSAVENPGSVFEAARVKYVVRFGFLWALLPSGRCLAYGAPRLKEQVWAKVKLEDGSWSDAEVMDRVEAERGERKGEIEIDGRTSDKVTVMSVDSTTKKWRRQGMYGGLYCENNTQAVARDLLVNGMFRVEAKGYPVIAHVYDEIIAEVPRGFGSCEEFEREMCILPDWAEGLPLTAGGWRGKRYRKD